MPFENTNCSSRKIGVIFPGMGYHSDKPLLYYGKKLLVEAGYEIMDLKYPSELPFENPIECFRRSETFVIPELDAVKWNNFNDIIFLSKSIGTIIAARYSKKVNARNIFCTPIPETIQYFNENGIAFHGESDPRMNTDELKKGCSLHGIPLYTYPLGNHSIETNDIIRNIEYIHDIAEKYKTYILKR